MMIDDHDIWRAANLLIKRYGDDAAVQAAQRADELFDSGDRDGYAIWKRILEAVKELGSHRTNKGRTGELNLKLGFHKFVDHADVCFAIACSNGKAIESVWYG